MNSELTIRQAIQFGMEQLSESSDSPKQDIEVLLCDVLQCSRTKLFVADETLLTATENNTFSHFIAQRKTGRPVSYIIGHQDFWTLSLEVNESTLIPRPETELLIEKVLELNLGSGKRCLDLGTGTGAIALAIACENSDWDVKGCDKVADAVALARHNQKKNDIENASFVVSSWFSELTEEKFDIILSNPPYVESDSEYLTKGDLRFEPMSALASGEDGLADIKIILSQAPLHLNQGGWLLIEHGFEQGQAIRDLFRKAGFNKVETVSDYAGKERVTFGHL